MKFLSIKDLVEGQNFCNFISNKNMKSNVRYRASNNNEFLANTRKTENRSPIHDNENLSFHALESEPPEYTDEEKNIELSTAMPPNALKPKESCKLKINDYHFNQTSDYSIESEELEIKKTIVFDTDKKSVVDIKAKAAEYENNVNKSLITLYRNKNKTISQLTNKNKNKNMRSSKIDFIHENVLKTKTYVGKRLRKKFALPSDIKVKSSSDSGSNPTKVIYRKPELLKHPFARYKGTKKEKFIHIKKLHSKPLRAIKDNIPSKDLNEHSIEKELIIIEEEEKPLVKVNSGQMEHILNRVKQLRRETINISRVPLPKQKCFDNVTKIFSEVEAKFKAVSGNNTLTLKESRTNTVLNSNKQKSKKLLKKFKMRNRFESDATNAVQKNTFQNQAGDWRCNQKSIMLGNLKSVTSKSKTGIKVNKKISQRNLNQLLKNSMHNRQKRCIGLKSQEKENLNMEKLKFSTPLSPKIQIKSNRISQSFRKYKSKK